MTVAEREKLIEVARRVRAHAYAPYSKFAVGAALRSTDGKIFTGCNVENASYGLTICAERATVTSAVAAGSRQFTAIAIATSGKVTPCGACRQVLAEFCPDLIVLLVDADRDDTVTELDLSRLLPNRFGP